MILRKLTLALVCLSFAATVAGQDSLNGFSDNFEVRRLDTEHFFLWEKDESIVNMGTRGMTIMSRGETPENGNVVYFNADADKWEAEVDILLYPASKGGLVLMSDRNHYWGIEADYNEIRVCNSGNIVSRARNPYGRQLHLKIQYADGQLVLSHAPQKTPWSRQDNGNPRFERKPADKWTSLATVSIDPSLYGLPTRIGMVAMKKDVVSFRDFWYRRK